MAESSGSSGAGGNGGQEITSELVRKVTDRVYEMLRLELKIDHERQRMLRRDLANRQKRGRL